MSDSLPARNGNTPLETRERLPVASGSDRVRDWLVSPLGRTLADVLPDIIRRASRRPEPEQRSFATQFLPATSGANGYSLSEVEVDVDAPFIRKITIRSGSSWSVAPDVILAEKKRRSKFRFGAIGMGLLGVAGLIFARRSGYQLPQRLRPSALAPSLSPGNGTTKTPGNIE